MNLTQQSHSTSKKALFSWCLYDWANSAFPTVITTFIFATYFTEKVAENNLIGTAQWGNTVAISAIGIALLSPALGGIADYAGRRKPWLAFFTLMAIISAAMLWTVQPAYAYAHWAMLWVILGTISFEVAAVFYNAMLKDIAPPKLLGRLSGWGWGLGYVGGLACLLLLLIGFVQTEIPWFSLDKTSLEHIRISGPVVAFWMGLFALPIFIFTPDLQPKSLTTLHAIRFGLKTFRQTINELPKHKEVLKFLLARMLYIDGLNTLFAFGGIYAAGTFGLSLQEVILFGIAMNVSAGVGAISFGWLDDAIGSKPTILLALFILITMGTALLFVHSITWFWVLALILGLGVGPVQAASRSLMARLTPITHSASFFGLFAFSGKATAFLGPLVFGWATLMFHSQRAGVATLLIFMVIGGLLLIPVKEIDNPHHSK